LPGFHGKGGKGGFTASQQHPPVIGRAASAKGGLDLSKMVPRTAAVKAKGKPAPVLHAKSAAKSSVSDVHAAKGAKSQPVIKTPVKLAPTAKGSAASKAAVQKAFQDREKDASQAKARARAAVATLEQQVDTLAAEVAKAAPQAPATWGKEEFIAASASAVKAIDSLRNKISGLTANIAGKLGNVTDAQGRATQAELSRLQNRMQQLRTALDGHTKSAKGMVDEAAHAEEAKDVAEWTTITVEECTNDEAFKAVVEACATFTDAKASADDKEQAKICIAEMAQSAVEMLDATIAQLLSRSQAPLPGNAAIVSRMRSTLQSHIKQLRSERDRLVAMRFVACSETLSEELKLEVEGAVALADSAADLKLDKVNAELKPDDAGYNAYWNARHEDGQKQRAQIDRAHSALTDARASVQKGLSAARNQSGGASMKPLIQKLDALLTDIQKATSKLSTATKSAQQDRDKAAQVVAQNKTKAEKQVSGLLAPLVKAESEAQCEEIATAANSAIDEHAASGALPPAAAEALRTNAKTRVQARVEVLQELAAKREKAEKEKAEREAAKQRLYDTYGGGSTIQADGVVKMGKAEYQVDVDEADADRMVKQIETGKGAGIPLARVAQLQSQLKVRADIVMQKLRKEKEEKERQAKVAQLQTILDGAQAAVEKASEAASNVEAAVTAMKKALLTSDGVDEIAALSALFPSASETVAATVELCRQSLADYPAGNLHPTYKKDMTKAVKAADAAKMRVTAGFKQLDTAQKAFVAAGEAVAPST